METSFSYIEWRELMRKRRVDRRRRAQRAVYITLALVALFLACMYLWWLAAGTLQ